MTSPREPSEQDEGLGPPPGPFQFRTRPRFHIPGGILRWAVPAVILIVLYILANIGKGIYADWLWFDSIDYLQVYRLRISTRVWLFFAGAGVFLAFFGTNLLIALRASRTDGEPVIPGSDTDPASAGRIIAVVAVAASLFLAVIFGAQTASHWDSILLFMNSEPFGIKDPQFNQDIGFYVFRLPTLNFIVGWSMGMVVLTTIVVSALYGGRVVLSGFASFAPKLARPHVSILLVIVIGLFVWRYWLSRYALLYSDRGAAFGAAYTDVNAQLPVIYILMALASLVAVAIIISLFRRSLLFLPIGAVGLWVVAAIVGGLIYPATVQQFTVNPNELAKEEKFIQRNIDATRFAYNLGNDIIDVQNFPASEAGVTAAEIADNPETIDNIRLWDNRPLRQTLNQLQAFSPLYDFLHVDIDRYVIDGELRQVMIAPRELDQTSLPEDKRSWVNTRLEFTHGFGLVMVPVNEVAPAGRPEYFIEQIPPVSVIDVEVEQPRIYYGEIPAHFIIVNTDEEEFDFPIGEGRNETTTFDGGGGVKLDSFLRKLVYAWEFGDFNVLISDAISDESRVLYRRNIAERVETVAPFLALDADPYLVVADGQLFWIQDAYTHTDRYPYSTRIAGLNYIRNSVKVVVSAYDGSMTFYRVDGDDPIAEVYDKIYPDLFTDLDEMPAVLRDHVRYPEDLFQIQAQVFRRYHIDNARGFFLGEGFWDIPTERFGAQEQLVEPYYVVMKLPGEEVEEFVLILPFRPRGDRRNSIAWLAARSDGENFGKLLNFRFPIGTEILGPSQVESSIDADPLISAQFTLWGQSGSEIVRGNLLMMPIGDGILFVEPIYLQATASQLPRLERVIVANGNEIAMEETLEDALNVVLGRAQASEPIGVDGDPSPTAEATPAPGETPAPTPTAQPTVVISGDVDELVQQANDTFELAQTLLQQGDFAGYGEEIEQLEEILQALAELTDLGE